jgi:hypothetical protein
VPDSLSGRGAGAGGVAHDEGVQRGGHADGLSSVEVATGNWSEAPHADLPALVPSADARTEFADKISSRGLTLSALCANGNQLHPVEGPQHDKVVRDTIGLAGDLGVPTVVMMSGLPGARGDSTPNWITTSWPPETLKVPDYQWNEVAHPVLDGARGVRQGQGRPPRDRGVRQPARPQRVHDAPAHRRGGRRRRSQPDPSHLMWMGADIPTVVRALGSAIFHVHAKDIRLQKPHADRDGLLDTLPIEQAGDRSWNYVTLGLGHPLGATFWCPASPPRPPPGCAAGLCPAGRSRRSEMMDRAGHGRCVAMDLPSLLR